MNYQVSNLSDLELTERAEEIAREQEARRVADARALRNQRSMFLPARPYVGVR